MINRKSLPTPYNSEYPTCERTYSELRIYSDHIKPGIVTELIGFNPTSNQEKGANWISPRGLEKHYSVNGWFLSSEYAVSSKDLRHHLDWLIRILEPVSMKLIKLQKMDLIMNVHCVWWSAHGEGGPTLWPQQMLSLAKLNLECSFEICFFGD